MAAGKATAGAAPPPPASARPDRMLDLDSPRVKAAMQELGVLPEELAEQEPPPSPEPSPVSTTLATSRSGTPACGELRERKRRELRQQVAAVAVRMEKKRSLARGSTGLDREIQKHDAKMERMQRNAKRGAEDLVLRELNWRITQMQGDQRKAGSAAAMAALLRAREDRKKELQKAGEKRHGKVQDSMEKAKASFEEQRQALIERISEVAERSAKNRADLELKRQESKPLWNFERQVDLTAKWNEGISRQEDEFWQRRDDDAQKLEMKHRDKAQNVKGELEKKRQIARSASAKSAEKLAQHHARRAGWENGQEEERQKIFQRLEDAQERRRATTGQAVEKSKAQNAKVVSTHAKAMEALEARQKEQQDELEEHFKRKLERMPTQLQVRSPAPAGVLAGSLDDSGTALAAGSSLGFSPPSSVTRLSGGHSLVADRREAYRQLAAENRERLARQALQAEQQKRAKIDQIFRRSNMIQDKKRHAAKLRQDLQKACIIQRDNLLFEFHRTKSCPANRMVPLIDQLGADAPAQKAIDSMLRDLGVERPSAAHEEEEQT